MSGFVDLHHRYICILLWGESHLVELLDICLVEYKNNFGTCKRGHYYPKIQYKIPLSLDRLGFASNLNEAPEMHKTHLL